MAEKYENIYLPLKITKEIYQNVNDGYFLGMGDYFQVSHIITRVKVTLFSKFKINIKNTISKS